MVFFYNYMNNVLTVATIVCLRRMMSLSRLQWVYILGSNPTHPADTGSQSGHFGTQAALFQGSGNLQLVSSS